MQHLHCLGMVSNLLMTYQYIRAMHWLYVDIMLIYLRLGLMQFKTVSTSHYASDASDLPILLFLLLKCWNYRHISTSHFIM